MTLRGGPPRDRRLHPRAITNLQAAVTAGDHAHSARVINLSMGGALLDLGAAAFEPPLAVGDPVTLAIRCRGRNRLLYVEARVVLWNTSASRVPLLAVQFGELGIEGSEILEELMWEALAQLRGRALAAS
jgi:hypothetical protein